MTMGMNMGKLCLKIEVLQDRGLLRLLLLWLLLDAGRQPTSSLDFSPGNGSGGEAQLRDTQTDRQTKQPSSKGKKQKQGQTTNTLAF